MRSFFLSVFLFFSTSLLAQEGDLYLKHFEVPLPDAAHQFNDLSTDQENRLLVAHQGGILQFDGKIWDKIATSSTPYKFISIGDTTFVLTKNSLSILRRDAFRRNVIEEVFKTPDFNRARDLVAYKDAYFYLVDKQLFKLSKKDFSVDSVYKSERGFIDIFLLKDRLYAFEDNFLLEYVDGTWVDLNKYVPEKSDFVFSCQNEDKVFFAYDNGDFFRFNGDNLSKYSPELNEYLKENYPVSGKIIKDRLLVATVSGGVVITDLTTSKIESSIQYHNGLPADEVMALTVDQQGGIWLAHDQGLSRALPELPLREFQHYPGLEGIPTSLFNYKDTLYVGTSAGLFYLEEIKDYEEFQKVLNRRVKVKNPQLGKENDQADNDSLEDFIKDVFKASEDSSTEVYIDEELERAKERFKQQGYRFRSLREKLSEKEMDLRDSIKNASKKGGEEKTADFSYKTVKKVVNVSKLKSIKYQYRKIPSLDKKVFDVLNIKGDIYVLAADGIYKVDQDGARNIYPKLFLSGFYYDQIHELLWIYGIEGLYKWDLQAESSPQLVSEEVIVDLCIEEEDLYVSTQNTLIHYSIGKGHQLKKKASYRFDNPYAKKVLLFLKDKQLRLIKDNGVYLLEDSLVMEKQYSSDDSYYIKDNLGQVWYSNGSEWNIVNKTDVEEELTWLKVLPLMSDVFQTDEKQSYFISYDMVLRFNGNKNFKLKETNSFIKGAYHASSEMFEGEDVILSHDENSLKISLSTPEYLFPEGVQYQYYVEGLMDKWSNWSKATEIEFPYIPTGDYVLQIRTKTGVYASVKEIEFDFEVLPPYWQTWWFYLLEIAFFSILILVSQRLNRSSRNTYLTNTITFLTLILFIEFLATVLENNLEGFVDESPVYGFLLNVVLALSISPLERVMNKLLMVVNTKKTKRLVKKMRVKEKENSKQDGKS